MKTLTVREYEIIKIGKKFEFNPPTITERQARELEKLSAGTRCNMFAWGRRSVVPQQYVGIISFGKIALEILPKIDKTDDNEIRHNLLHMLSICRKLDIRESQLASLAKKPMNLLEMFIRIFCVKLFAQVHRGVIRKYQTFEENLTMLRGSFLIPEQLRFNSVDKARFFCRYDEFKDDNPYNRILKCALKTILHYARSEENRRLIQKLLDVFEDVKKIDASPQDVDELTFDRTIRRFESIFQIAKLILSGFTPDVTSGGNPFFALLFDMNELFEEYIGRMVQNIYGGEAPVVYLQGPHKYLVKEHCHGGVPHFRMKPDIVIRAEENIHKIIDTKWKILSQAERNLGVSSADMYQMYAYAHRYVCPEIVLLYPHYSSMDLEPGTLKRFKVIKDTVEEIIINVATISLKDVRSSSIQAQLRKILIGNTIEPGH